MKISANDVRIGNYYDQFGYIEQVTWSVIRDLTTAPDGQLWCKPIPLTPEWLEKLGFIRRTPTGYYFDMGRMSINIPDFEYKNIRIDVKLQYIHQLQNIYFAITGTELTLTEQNHDTTGTN